MLSIATIYQRDIARRARESLFSVEYCMSRCHLVYQRREVKSTNTLANLANENEDCRRRIRSGPSQILPITSRTTPYSSMQDAAQQSLPSSFALHCMTGAAVEMLLQAERLRHSSSGQHRAPRSTCQHTSRLVTQRLLAPSHTRRKCGCDAERDEVAGR